MARQRQHGSPNSAAQLAVASDDAAQPSSLPSSVAQPVDESYRRACDGMLYTRAEFHAHYGSRLGEAHWQTAQNELTESDGPADLSAEQPADEIYRRAGDGSSTRENSSTSIMVLTAGKRAGRRRSTSSPNGTNLQMLARLVLHDFAALNSLPHLFIALRNLLRAPRTQHTHSTPNT